MGQRGWQTTACSLFFCGPWDNFFFVVLKNYEKEEKKDKNIYYLALYRKRDTTTREKGPIQINEIN